MIRFLNRLQPCALTMLRLVLGVAMLIHGWDKLIPAGGLHRTHLLSGAEAFGRYVATLHLPYWLGYVSVVTEFFGGLCLVLGLLTRFWALLIAGDLLVAIVKVDIHHGYTGSQYSLTLLVIALMLLVAGSGALSLDRRFGLS
jgi:putative oxidoreductase